MINFHNSFSPAVNWSTVRLNIMMAEIYGWESIKINYYLAFYQAPIYSDVYLRSTSNWFDMLKTGLEDEGFKKKVDPCIFVRNNCILICYVGDCCIFSKDKEIIDALLKNLSNTFKLIDEGVVKSYIGMNVRKYPNGIITMSQPEHFILKNINMEMEGRNNGTIVH